MQYHTVYRAFQPHAEFEQAFPQGAHLRPRTRGAGRPQAQLLEQHVGGRAQQHPQLIGPEARATLLGAVRRVISRIQFHRDALHAPFQPFAVPGNDRIRQGISHAHQRLRSQGILEARERRLRSQCGTFDRIPLQQQRLHRILSQSLDVVAVFEAAGNAEHALAHQITEAVNHLARLPCIRYAGCNRSGQAKALIASLEQDCSAIGTTVRLVNTCHNRFVEQILEQNRLCCGIVSLGKASDVWKSTCGKDFLAQKRPFFL